MCKFGLLILTVSIFSCFPAKAQFDSAQLAVPVKYLTVVNAKIDRYCNQVNRRKEKTLHKLSRWENKIHTLLIKADPSAAEKLFGNDQTTFSNLLNRIQSGKSVVTNFTAQYDSYKDKLTTGLKYLDQQKLQLDKKLVKPVTEANKKILELQRTEAANEQIELFIKERKKQIVDEAIKHIRNSKWLTKIDKEAFYYLETVRNYKELFSDPKKVEKLVIKILNEVPSFRKFSEANSQLASLFGLASGYNNNQNLANLQTRASIQTLIQERLVAGGPNVQQQFREGIQYAQEYLNQLKDKIAKAGAGSSDANMPDFKPNMQRTKTFLQRLEYGTNIQFSKTNNIIP
ncbi:MAG TPA: hypothetical protein VKH37_08305, partial [Ferruginibacter sp.]|nr:hypothetical protein [Ferruginibacter sp.]